MTWYLIGQGICFHSLVLIKHWDDFVFNLFSALVLESSNNIRGNYNFGIVGNLK
jgi:hypothetical protein